MTVKENSSGFSSSVTVEERPFQGRESFRINRGFSPRGTYDR